ncbi:MAG TPA: site-2 protease family protein [Pirellulales bacterium]|nr:site-2 protease family protein [Pirellulales bacterium]
MRDLLSWNLSLGRWAGVQVRLHVFFVLFAVVAVHLSARDHLTETLAVLGVLFFCVLAHEFAHCGMAWYVGGTADQILIWPLGGLAQVNVSHEPQHELATALAGPSLNFLLCALTAPLVWASGEDGVKPLHALLRFVPPAAVSGFGWVDVLRWTFWINWLLLSVNLLPAFPLDGGRALRCLLWPMWGFKKSALVVSLLAKFMAVGLGMAAWSTSGSKDYDFAALPLLLLGLLLFFSAKQEADRLRDSDLDDALLGYDFSRGYTSLERAPTAHKPSPGLVRNWLDERRAARLLRQQQIEAEEERRVDEVLARLHESGLHTLSDEDRALLDRVSARYRNRLRG